MSHRPDPRAEYTRRLEARQASLVDANRRHINFGNLRLAVLVTGLAAAYATFATGLFSAWWLLAPVAAYFWVGGQLEGAIKARTRFERSVAFYQRALARLDGRWSGVGGETGVRFLDDAHLYALDLDLFGNASLFELLNAARTRMGEETLAAWLKAPAAPEVVHARHDAVVELASQIDLREDVAVLGETARSGVHSEALASWGERPPTFRSSAAPVWAWLLSVAGFIATIALIVQLAAYLGVIQIESEPLLLFQIFVATMFLVCGGVSWRFSARTTAIFAEVEHAAEDLALLSGVLGRLERERFNATRLTTLRAALDVEGLPPSRRIATLNTLTGLVDSRDHFFLRLAGPLVLWDVHLAYAIERWRRTSGPALRRWLTAVGEIEALLSLAGYHYERPDDVFPEFDAGPSSFDGDALGHPLLADAISIRNDVRLGDAPRVLVVSGSNMSGKTTLLRTVGVNAVLAQAGAPVRATRLRLTPLEIGASIRIQDSLQAGVSRFYAEITRLSRVMRRAEHAPVLFLIDEVLHGTNSYDRGIGAEAIVRGLVDRGAIGLVTTHDLALTRVADALGARGANVHFQDILEDGQMRFDYRMRPGVVQKSNALALMRAMGLDV